MILHAAPARPYTRSTHTAQAPSHTGSLRRCIALGLSAQAVGAARLSFSTAERDVVGTLRVNALPGFEYEPEALDQYRLLDALTPCGPFVRLPQRGKQSMTPQDIEALVPVRDLPSFYDIDMSGANASAHACVRAAAWETARHAGGDATPSPWRMMTALALVGAVLGLCFAMPVEPAPKEAP